MGVEMKLSTDKTTVNGRYEYQTLWHKIIRRKTFYFSHENGNFAYWIDRKRKLHPQKYKETNK